jgi:hypothetical protein
MENSVITLEEYDPEKDAEFVEEVIRPYLQEIF